jgi:hypothetical protein
VSRADFAGKKGAACGVLFLSLEKNRKDGKNVFYPLKKTRG